MIVKTGKCRVEEGLIRTGDRWLSRALCSLSDSCYSELHILII